MCWLCHFISLQSPGSPAAWDVVFQCTCAGQCLFHFTLHFCLMQCSRDCVGYHNSPLCFAGQIYYTQTCKDLNLQVIYYILVNDLPFSADLTISLQSCFAFPEIKYYNIEKHTAKKAKSSTSLGIWGQIWSLSQCKSCCKIMLISLWEQKEAWSQKKKHFFIYLFFQIFKYRGSFYWKWNNGISKGQYTQKDELRIEQESQPIPDYGFWRWDDLLQTLKVLSGSLWSSVLSRRTHPQH